MSTSSNSSHHQLLDAIQTLHHCLSDPNCIIQEQDRIKLTTTFHNFKRQLHSSLNQLDYSTNSNIISTDENEVNSLANQFNDFFNVFNISSISQPNVISDHNGELKNEMKMAILCFLLFEVGVNIKKRDLVYWWVGLGLIDVEGGEDIEKAVDVMISKLIEVGVIEQVFNSVKQKKTSKYRLSMKMCDQNDYQNVGLLRNERNKLMVCDFNGMEVDENLIVSIEILFNPGLSILTIKRDWFRKMKNLKVLHLGRWSSDPEQHTEVEKLGFLEGLKYLKDIRFLSLKGISRIMELGNEICQLGNLRVLDLQACPNLEVLPKRIGMLVNLTHLDVSKCYLLDRIPKGITSLTKLQVLEGFVIGDVHSSSSCKFKDLANHLGTSLKKLSIRTRELSFPIENDLKSFAKFEKLLTLKIVWVRTSNPDGEEEEETSVQKTHETTLNLTQGGLKSRSFVRNLTKTFRGEPYNLGLPEQLQELEVQAIPQMAMKSLMLRNQERLVNLEKLSVIGGELSDINDQGKIKWRTIKRLRLKHLAKLHMNWRQFKASFPCVTYLEVTRCPNLSFFPCDYHGIWRQDKDH